MVVLDENMRYFYLPLDISYVLWFAMTEKRNVLRTLICNDGKKSLKAVSLKIMSKIYFKSRDIIFYSIYAFSSLLFIFRLSYWYILSFTCLIKEYFVLHLECYLCVYLWCFSTGECSINAKKCRARYGMDQQKNWCKPCR